MNDGWKLVWSDDLLASALAVRDEFGRNLVGRGLTGTVNLVGGLSGPGLLTKGDVDLHLCVPTVRFGAVVAELTAWLTPTTPEAWSDTLRVFAAPESRGLPVGVAVTPHNSEHDLRFTCAWTAIRDSALLRARYNEFKRASKDDYKDAKGAFFNELESHVTAGSPSGDVCQHSDGIKRRALPPVTGRATARDLG